jgi:putative transposase
MTASIAGTSTRKVEDLVEALGCDSSDWKSIVLRICTDIDQDVTGLRERRLDGIPFAYLWLDATILEAKENRRVAWMAVAIATAVRVDGHGEIVRVNFGDSENEMCLTEFLRDLTDRGLCRVQRCRAHAPREALAPSGTSAASASQN